MKQQLNQLIQAKRTRLKKLSNLRTEYLATIYEGVCKKKSIREIHKDIRKVTSANSGLTDKNLHNTALAIATKMKKAIGNDFSLAFATMNKIDAYHVMKQETYQNTQKFESNLKQEIINTELETNRHLNDVKVFYLASTHGDCANDHYDYQGKIYVDSKWKFCNIDSEVKQEINKYIHENNIKTLQWVTGKPVWFVTRPNCRHYFKALKTTEVMGDSLNSLIKKHDMKSKIGNEETKTVYHSLKKEWYNQQNILSIINQYEERLKYHEALYKVAKEPIIAKAIEKDKFLLRKWRNYLQNKKK